MGCDAARNRYVLACYDEEKCGLRQPSSSRWSLSASRCRRWAQSPLYLPCRPSRPWSTRESGQISPTSSTTKRTSATQRSTSTACLASMSGVGRRRRVRRGTAVSSTYNEQQAYRTTHSMHTSTLLRPRGMPTAVSPSLPHTSSLLTALLLGGARSAAPASAGRGGA